MPRETKEHQSRQLNMKVKPSQYDAYAKAAERDGRTVSGWVRHQADKALRREAT